MSNAELNFVRQQGFRDAGSQSCGVRYDALMFQPRLIGAIVLIGLISQAWPLFLVLSAVLWWNVAVPEMNPFDVLYNRLLARPRHLSEVAPAPGPRRFSQAMAASFMLGIGLSLWAGNRALVWTFEAFLVVALTALILGRFCLGSYIYHWITGAGSFANHTLPWSRSE